MKKRGKSSNASKQFSIQNKVKIICKPGQNTAKKNRRFDSHTTATENGYQTAIFDLE